jgi:hypothetical protein
MKIAYLESNSDTGQVVGDESPSCMIRLRLLVTRLFDTSHG